MRSQNEGKWQMRRTYITKTEIGEGEKGSATGRERFYLIYPSLHITDIYCIRYSQLNRHNVTMLQPSGRVDGVELSFTDCVLGPFHIAMAVR